ncbi:hypothetical protein L7F22_051798 [Adiantum nelumboides]|nr:hypothetical protein [Adiantum nelumboides]
MEDVHANADIMVEFCHFKRTSKQISKEDVKTAKQQLQQQGSKDDSSITEEIEDDDIHIESWRWHSIFRKLFINGANRTATRVLQGRQELEATDVLQRVVCCGDEVEASEVATDGRAGPQRRGLLARMCVVALAATVGIRAVKLASVM